jgi:hypothetical protein
MTLLKAPLIVAVDRLNDGLCIYFADGINSYYPSTLLYSALGIAEVMSQSDSRSRGLIDESYFQE